MEGMVCTGSLDTARCDCWAGIQACRGTVEGEVGEGGAEVNGQSLIFSPQANQGQEQGDQLCMF